MPLGMDLGSREVKIVEMTDGLVVGRLSYDTARFYREFGRVSGGSLSVSFDALGFPGHKNLVLTGYGRNTIRMDGAAVISEVKAHTLGAIHQTGLMDFTLLDIGGQDTKVMKVTSRRMEDFVMNDKCAASSGRYIENMARVLGMELSELSLYFQDPASLSATCAVFGESEIIHKMAEGVPQSELAAGVNLTIVKRTLPMLGRFPVGPIVFAGGVARSPAIARLLERHTGRSVITVPEPSYNGALGCALYA
ncbi:MAG: acyl-CoA dehydratase activase [Nitrospirota bacterium]